MNFHIRRGGMSDNESNKDHYYICTFFKKTANVINRLRANKYGLQRNTQENTLTISGTQRTIRIIEEQNTQTSMQHT